MSVCFEHLPCRSNILFALLLITFTVLYLVHYFVLLFIKFVIFGLPLAEVSITYIGPYNVNKKNYKKPCQRVR